MPLRGPPVHKLLSQPFTLIYGAFLFLQNINSIYFLLKMQDVDCEGEIFGFAW
jgi:hypothetical protein